MNWAWLSADNLPVPADPKRVERDQEAEDLYRRQLERRPVLDALETVAQRLQNVERP